MVTSCYCFVNMWEAEYIVYVCTARRVEYTVNTQIHSTCLQLCIHVRGRKYSTYLQLCIHVGGPGVEYIVYMCTAGCCPVDLSMQQVTDILQPQDWTMTPWRSDLGFRELLSSKT